MKKVFLLAALLLVGCTRAVDPPGASGRPCSGDDDCMGREVCLLSDDGEMRCGAKHQDVGTDMSTPSSDVGPATNDAHPRQDAKAGSEDVGPAAEAGLDTGMPDTDADVGMVADAASDVPASDAMLMPADAAPCECVLANVAEAACVENVCTVVRCAEGFVDTNGQPADGCEADAPACTPLEGAVCCDGQMRPCGVNLGACRRGMQTCVGGMWAQACNGEVRPSEEVCNGLDDDCDGTVDDDGANGQPLSQRCGSSLGVCHFGQQHCAAGNWGDCEGDASPSDELCNGLDDDCDGIVDDGPDGQPLVLCCDGHPANGACCTPDETRPCGTDVGSCVSGTETCLGDGTGWGSCEGSSGPQEELCDNAQEGGEAQDENCNGTANEGFAQVGDPCASGIGVCQRQGSIVCSADGRGTVCDAQAGMPTEPGQEVTCNGLDDDCDGRVDQTPDGQPLSEPCGNATGVCQRGVHVCTDGQLGAECVGEVGPAEEVCNDFDDDCNGMTDENLFRPCEGAAVGVCLPGRQACVGGVWTAQCEGAVSPSPEVCDGLDNDCNGMTDENLFRPCAGAAVGICLPGQQRCVGGVWGEQCEGAVSPSPEVCNGVDEDCDGTVFEPDCTHRGFTKLVIVPHASNIVPCGVDRCLRATTAAGQIVLTLHGTCEQFDAAGWIRFDGNCYLEWNDPAIPPLFVGDWSVEAAFQPGAGNAFPDFVYWVNDELPALRAGQQNIDTLTWAYIHGGMAIGQDLPPGRDVVTTLSYIGGTLTAAGQSLAVPNPAPSGRILRVGGDGHLDREFFGLIYWVVVR